MEIKNIIPQSRDWLRKHEHVLKVSAYLSLLFIVVASSIAYSFTQMAFGTFVTIVPYQGSGPSFAGLILHGLVFFASAFAIINKLDK